MTVDTQALAETFEARFQRRPTVISEAPGRVNLMGEHTDYNGGFVLPVAIDRSVAVAAAPTGQDRVRVVALDPEECDEFDLNSTERTRGDSWRNYVRGCAGTLREAGYSLRGADLAITGDIQQGSGLSSSAALELAVAGAFCAVSGIELTARDLALLCQKVENEFVGVQCGIMDQFAAALCRSAYALLIDCRSLELQHIPLPPKATIVVIDSKVPRNLVDTPYNQRQKQCAEAARLLGLASLRDANESMLTAARLPESLRRRARHVVTENERVLATADALGSGQSEVVGALLLESHASLRDDFEVSIPELDLLVALASKTSGALGAKLTGAGFGGCTVNFVHQDAVAAFRAAVVEPYRQRTGLPAEMYVCRSADGLKVSRV